MGGRWLQVPGDISGYIQDRVMGLGLDLPSNTTSTIIGMKFLSSTQHHQETSDRGCRYTTYIQRYTKKPSILTTINISQYISPTSGGDRPPWGRQGSDGRGPPPPYRETLLGWEFKQLRAHLIKAIIS